MKPKDPVWNMFTIYEMNGKNVVICKDFNSSVSAKSDRLHSKKCVPTRTPQKRPHEVVACMYST